MNSDKEKESKDSKDTQKESNNNNNNSSAPSPLLEEIASLSERLKNIRPTNVTLGGAIKKSIKPKVPQGQVMIPIKEEEMPLVDAFPQPFKRIEKKDGSKIVPKPPKSFPQKVKEEKTKEQENKKEQQEQPPPTTFEFKKIDLSDTPTKKSKKALTAAWKIDESQLNDPYYPTVFPYENWREAEMERFESKEPHFMKKNELILLQLPNLPVKSEADSIKSETHTAKEAPQIPPFQSSKTSEDTFKSNLTNIPPGELGTLRIRKSGKMELKIGEIIYEIQEGTKANFEEELMLVLPQEGKCIHLGNINRHYLCLPDFDKLLNT